MRLSHFHELRPICLTCRAADAAAESPLSISHSIRESNEDILEGLLRCTDPNCQYEYPVIDGIPLLLPNVREYVASNIGMLQARTDLSPTTISVLGDCCGPASSFEVTRQQLSSYSWCHYGDLDPENSDAAAGSTVQLLASFPATQPTDGPVLDLGCSVGRTTFELAEHSKNRTLGIDVNLSMLRIASSALRTGVVRFPLKRVGLVYDQRSFPVQFAESENVDFWACDALSLPFGGDQFARLNCLNTLDSVPSPVGLLQSIAGVASSGATVSLACPYDWSSAVTPVEAWIGGHSQRAEHGGLSSSVLRHLFVEDVNGPAAMFEIVEERTDVPWIVRLHDRGRMTYSTDALTLRRK